LWGGGSVDTAADAADNGADTAGVHRGDGIADRRTCVGRGCRLRMAIYLLFLRGAPLRLPKAPKSSIPAPTQGKRPADVDEAAFEGEGLGGGGEGQRGARHRLHVAVRVVIEVGGERERGER